MKSKTKAILISMSIIFTILFIILIAYFASTISNYGVPYGYTD